MSFRSGSNRQTTYSDHWISLCYGTDASNRAPLSYFEAQLCVLILIPYCDGVTTSCAFQKFMFLQLCHIWPLFLTSHNPYIRYAPLQCFTLAVYGSISWQNVLEWSPNVLWSDTGNPGLTQKLPWYEKSSFIVQASGQSTGLEFYSSSWMNRDLSMEWEAW